MKLKQIYTLISIFLFTFNGISQTKNDGYENYSAYDLDYINDNGFKDLRLRKKGDKAVSLYYFIPFDYNTDGIEVDSNFSISNQHRITERLTPNFKFYINDKTNIVFGIFYRRINQRLVGTLIDGTQQKETSTGQGVYLRFGLEKHLSLIRFKKFDLDLYAGSSLALGFIPQTDKDNYVFDAGQFMNTTTSSKSFGLGLDLYTGVNIQFDRFSLGAEIIGFGFDYNKGFGKNKIVTETNSGTTEIFTSENTPGQFSKLNVSSNKASMYGGIRLTASFYF